MATIPPPPPRQYQLFGPQVEPTTSFWLDQPAIRVPTIKAVRTHANNSANPRLFLEPALFPDDQALVTEFAFLKKLEGKRPTEPYPLVKFGLNPPGDFRAITPLSRFIQLQQPPFGAVFDTVETVQDPVTTVRDQQLRILNSSTVVREGRELSRMFEEETPGLYHRHALNWLLFLRPDVSPPRQARIWMGLDMAIYTALCAAWFYKWRSAQRRLLRPSEWAVRHQKSFTVLFDEVVNDRGHDEGSNDPRDCPLRPPGSEAWHPLSPGTPRHPSWPSGHSTFSAAASYMLEYFFSPDTLGTPDDQLFKQFPAGAATAQSLLKPGWIAAELRRLANNIGEARLWAGVHWVSDHVAGQRIGRAAAQAVIDTFLKDIICPFEAMMCDNNNLPPPPNDQQLKSKWNDCRNQPDAKQDFIPQPKRADRQELAKEFGVI
jgi:membrane-associated phospholipid phosphatase